jgi:predicted acylesterase/phospholipase RssA
MALFLRESDREEVGMTATENKTFRDKLVPTRQKKLLALDGGGIRGVITLEILAAIEIIVRGKLGPNAVLSDYFDYLAGTSTGAIIAACLSVGMSVADVREFYVASGPEMFSKASVLERFRYKFGQDHLAAQLKQVFGATTTLGSDRLRTLLMMIMRNATTDSPWPLSNNPRARYNDPARQDSNLNLPLWQLVRASTAAPTYFPPEVVQVGEHSFLFVDGGVTMYNNPAFQLFLMATVEPYNLQWPVGVDRMLLVSVGTGTSPEANANLQPNDMNLLYNAGSIPSALMYAALNEQDFLCRTFGDCRAGCALDREIGDMRGMAGPVPKLFTYMRYNAELTQDGFNRLGLAASGIKPADVQALDSVEHISQMQTVGRAVVEKEVKSEHFQGF